MAGWLSQAAALYGGMLSCSRMIFKLLFIPSHHQVNIEEHEGYRNDVQSLIETAKKELQEVKHTKIT